LETNFIIAQDLFNLFVLIEPDYKIDFHSFDNIKHVFKKLSLKLHPDKIRNVEDKNALFVLLKNAYEFLCCFHFATSVDNDDDYDDGKGPANKKRTSKHARRAKKENKDKNQYFGTTVTILDVFWNNIKFVANTKDVTIYDPMCGKSAAMVSYFTAKDCFKHVYGTDLYYGDTRIDFLTLKKEQLPTNTAIITNTPFCPLNVFINHLLDLDVPFATIVPFYAVNYKSMRRLFTERSKQTLLLSCGTHCRFD
jgi:hypothetical protein